MSQRRPSRRDLRAREGGYAAILVAMLAAAFFIPITALAVDVARWYVELERVQTAADAAATAGVTYMPDDFANAKATAITVSGKNGYPNSGSSTVSVEATSKPSQLRVTVTSKIRNAFGTGFGQDFTTVSRSAVADFNGPAPMGSPCNAYGNEPVAALSPDANRGPSSRSSCAKSRGKYGAAITRPALPMCIGASSSHEVPRPSSESAAGGRSAASESEPPRDGVWSRRPSDRLASIVRSDRIC